MKRMAKKVMADLEGLGFEQIWRNTAGEYVFAHPDDPEQLEIKVSPSLSEEHTAKAILGRCRRIAGVAPVIVKRHGEQVKERAAAERERERERAEQRLRWAEAKLARLESDRADEAYRRRVEELIEHRRAELAALHREMTESPQGGQHVGRGRVDVIASGGVPL